MSFENVDGADADIDDGRLPLPILKAPSELSALVSSNIHY